MKIFQTWKSKDPKTFTEMYSYCYGSWQEVHPDWEYQLYDDNDIQLYCKTHFPQYYEKFMSLSQGILRADLIRYMFMYVEGGLYVDMDFMALKHHSEIQRYAKTKKCDIVFGCLTDSNKNGFIPNAWMMSLTPKHDFWLALLKYGFSFTQLNGDPVESMTGPDLLRKCIDLYKKRNNSSTFLILPTNYVYPCSWHDDEQLEKMRKWVYTKKPKSEFNLPESYAITFWNHNW